MKDGNHNTVTNPVLREALERVEQRKRCAFPHWGNIPWGNIRWFNVCGPWVNLWLNWACWANIFGCAWCNTYNNWANGQ